MNRNKEQQTQNEKCVGWEVFLLLLHYYIHNHYFPFCIHYIGTSYNDIYVPNKIINEWINVEIIKYFLGVIWVMNNLWKIRFR